MVNVVSRAFSEARMRSKVCVELLSEAFTEEEKGAGPRRAVADELIRAP